MGLKETKLRMIIRLPPGAGDRVTADPLRRAAASITALGNVVNYLLPPSGLELLQGIVGCCCCCWGFFFFSQVDEPDETILLDAASDKEIGVFIKRSAALAGEKRG